MLRSIGCALLLGMTLSACAGGADRDFSRTDSDKAPHFGKGATVTGANVRGGG